MQLDAFVNHSIFFRIEGFIAIDHVAVNTIITVEKAPFSASGFYSSSNVWFESIATINEICMGDLTALVFVRPILRYGRVLSV